MAASAGCAFWANSPEARVIMLSILALTAKAFAPYADVIEAKGHELTVSVPADLRLPEAAVVRRRRTTR